MNFVFDLDGTICFRGRPISKHIMDLLFELQETGHSVCFASARPWRDMLPVLDGRFHDNLLIGANGAMVVRNSRIDFISDIPQDLAVSLLGILDDHHAKYLVDDTWDYAHNLSLDHPFLMNIDISNMASRTNLNEVDRFVKIVVLDCDDFSGLTSSLQQLNVTIHHHSKEGILDITTCGVNKMAALRKTGFDSANFICFGNDLNDKHLFEEAIHSVLIGELPQLKELAKEQILLDDKTEESIIKKIRELVKK